MTNRRLPLFVALCFAVALLTPGEARANSGVPMIFLTWPGMVLALIPVILLEMVVIRKRLDLPRETAFKVSAWANIATTFAGIPITWILLVALEMVTGGGQAYGIDTPFKKFLAVTWQGAWMIPYEANKNLYWMVPAATMWLLVPSFFVSWWLEYKVAAKLLPDAGRQQLKSTMFRANLLSYFYLEMIVLGWLVYEIVFEL
ncbi:MAG: hypothetical protein HY795_09400 [Desulfovibrio sp.]|nr:hypothetical protein [Desulfovibrio sp.]